MSQAKVKSIRAFLNPPSSDDTGSIECVVEKWSSEYSNTVTIRDCSRTIELDFSFRDAATKTRRIKKIRKLIKVLSDYEIMLGNTDM
jgi:hypothetical protein